jgi:hypothetical protein
MYAVNVTAGRNLSVLQSSEFTVNREDLRFLQRLRFMIKTPCILKADINILEDRAATLKRLSATGRRPQAFCSCAIVQ